MRSAPPTPTATAVLRDGASMRTTAPASRRTVAKTSSRVGLDLGRVVDQAVPENKSTASRAATGVRSRRASHANTTTEPIPARRGIALSASSE